ncbi:MAG: hemerythrin domain-containing protein [Archangiaceae bacterium]|nr:hemerythrin domain-containing protein [Archangiaceae bacterium]
MNPKTRLSAQELRERRQTLRDTLPPLLPLAEKVARVHGDHELHLEEVSKRLADLSIRLIDHLDREDCVWPAAGEGPGPTSTADAVILEADHVELRGLLHELRAAAGGYVVPDWACSSYQRLLRGLDHLHAEVSLQMQLENVALST